MQTVINFKAMAQFTGALKDIIQQSDPDLICGSGFFQLFQFMEEENWRAFDELGLEGEKLYHCYKEILGQLCILFDAETARKRLLALVDYWHNEALSETLKEEQLLFSYSRFDKVVMFSGEEKKSSSEDKIVLVSSSPFIKTYKLEKRIPQKILLLQHGKKKSRTVTPSALQNFIVGLIKTLNSEEIIDLSFQTLRLAVDEELRQGFDGQNFLKRNAFIEAYVQLLLEVKYGEVDLSIAKERISKILGDWYDEADYRFPAQIEQCIDVLIQLIENISPEHASDLDLDKLIKLMPFEKQELFRTLNANQAKTFAEGFKYLVLDHAILDLNWIRSELLQEVKSWKFADDEFKEVLLKFKEAFLFILSETEANVVGDLSFASVLKKITDEDGLFLEAAKQHISRQEKCYISLYLDLEKPVYTLKRKFKLLDALENLRATAHQSFPEKGKTRVKPQEIKLKDVYNDLCQIDAYADILRGRMQRLDPVIQEAGCQWRVPFVLDIHELFIVSCESIPFWDGALDIYESVRASGCDVLGWLKDYDCMRNLAADLLKSKPGKKSKDIWEYVISDTGFWDFICRYKGLIGLKKGDLPDVEDWRDKPADLEKLCAAFEAEMIARFLETIDLVKEFASEFLFLIELLKKRQVKLDAMVDPIKKYFDSADYLTLCKTFTINRIRRMDVFGLSGVRHDLKLPYSKKEESDYTIALAKYSRKYMKYVAQKVVDFDIIQHSDDYKRISEVNLELVSTNKVGTFQNSSAFTTHVFYGPLRTIFAYQSVKKQPIIIDIRRLECVSGEEELYRSNKSGKKYNQAKFKLNGAALLYFEPDNKGNFVYCHELTEQQKNTPAMYVECFSILRKDKMLDAEGEFALLCPESFEDYVLNIVKSPSIINWILCGASFHDEFPYPLCWKEGKGQKRGRLERRRDEDVIEADKLIARLYKEAHGDKLPKKVPHGSLVDFGCPLLGVTTEDMNLALEREMFMDLVHEFGINSIAYKDYSDDRATAYRNDEPVVLAPIHIYGSTYANKILDLLEMIRKNKEGDIVIARLMDPKDEFDMNV